MRLRIDINDYEWLNSINVQNSNFVLTLKFVLLVVLYDLLL